MFEGEIARLYTAYIALGSNLEPRMEHLREAIKLLRTRMEVEAISPIYETVPFGHTAQPEFLNAVVRVLTPNGPLELLNELHAFEQQIGRQERPRWHEREIDFDILFYEDLVLHSPDLTIPHPGIPERAFVLVPMSDLSSTFVHPGLKKSIAVLLEEVDRSGVRKTDLILQ